MKDDLSYSTILTKISKQIDFDSILLFLYLETYISLFHKPITYMRYFETLFLEEANVFIAQLNPKTIKKILYNIDLAEQTNDPKIFKKLQHDIWEFRTKSFGLQIRLLAFWDKSNNTRTLVVATHGFIKKTDKVPGNEIDRAIKLKNNYLENKQNK